MKVARDLPGSYKEESERAGRGQVAQGGRSLFKVPKFYFNKRFFNVPLCGLREFFCPFKLVFDELVRRVYERKTEGERGVLRNERVIEEDCDSERLRGRNRKIVE